MSHGEDPSPAVAGVAAHPLVARLPGALPEGVSVVGGVVRDALLGRPPGDEVDVVVEGDAIAVAERLGRALGARVTSHPRFGTASIELPHGGRIDLVSARTESYSAPGELPRVAPGSLLDDLARRDITINAMAVPLGRDGPGPLVDPHGGAADCAARVVRIIRDDALTEDPSRLVRVARYAERLGFRLESGTEDAARAVASALDPSSARVAEELRRLLEEPAAGRALARMRGLGVPWVPFDAEVAVAALDVTLDHPAAPALPRWAVRLGAGVELAALEHLATPGWARAMAREAAMGSHLADRLGAASSRSEVDRLLRAAAPASAVGALAAGADVVERWWEEDRDREPAVGGADLVAAGVPPGPAIGRALAAVRAALLDGEVEGREEQLALALRVADGAT